MQLKIVLYVCALTLVMGACEVGEGSRGVADTSSRHVGTSVHQDVNAQRDAGQQTHPVQVVIPRSAGSGPYGAPGAPPSDGVPCGTSWELTLGGAQLDSAADALELPSGGLIIVGQTYLQDTIGPDGWPEKHPHAFVSRVSSMGELEWFTHFDAFESALAVSMQSGGIILVAGMTLSEDAFLAALTTDGAALWSHVYGGEKYELINDTIVTSDGSVHAVGCNLTLGGMTPVAWVLRTDAQGEPVSEHTFGDETGGDLYSAIEVRRGGGTVVSGYLYRQEAQWAANTLVARFDTTGALVWQKEFGGTCFSSAYETIELTQGGFAVAGYTCESSGMSYDPFLMVLTSEGELISKRIYEEPGTQHAHSLIEDTGGLTAVLSTNTPGGRLLHTDLQGNVLWEEVYAAEPSRIMRSRDGGIILIGKDATKSDAWAAKFAAEKDGCGRQP